MTRRNLVADLHPAPQTLGASLARAGMTGANSGGHETRRATLSAMALNSDFGQSSFCKARMPEPDLQAFRDDLT